MVYTDTQRYGGSRLEFVAKWEVTTGSTNRDGAVRLAKRLIIDVLWKTMNIEVDGITFPAEARKAVASGPTFLPPRCLLPRAK